jgi:hypothetical protein
MGTRDIKDGAVYDDVILETTQGSTYGGPIARAISGFPPDTEVRLDRSLRQEFPIGTRFRASVTARIRMRSSKRQFYLQINNVSVIVDSIPDDNLRAILNRMKADSTASKVRNCKSAYKCAAKWEDLQSTEIINVRHCGECAKNVTLCATIADIRRALNDGMCIAAKAAAISDHTSGPATDFVGFVPEDESRTF